MSTAVFADSVYWIALINPADQWFAASQNLSPSLENRQIITTGEVLIETLNFYAEDGSQKRDGASYLIRSILLDIRVEVVSANQDGFFDGLNLYESRNDKGYSLTDCISMNLMRERGISDVLTRDDHFTQEGFNTLL